MNVIASYSRFVSGLVLLFCLASCKTKPYSPAPKKVVVESIEVNIREFEGRPDAYALVKGRLSSSVAQLVDADQSREGTILHISVMEQTPRGAVAAPDMGASPPFETRIPIDILGLKPGTYTVEANGVMAKLEVPEVLKSDSQSFAQQAEPYKVKWKPAPLPAGTVKMLPPMQVNQPPRTPQLLAQSDDAASASDPFSVRNETLPPGMTASVSMEPPSPLRTGSKPKPVPKKSPDMRPENVLSIEELLGPTDTFSTFSGRSGETSPNSTTIY